MENIVNTITQGMSDYVRYKDCIRYQSLYKVYEKV